MVQNNQKTNFHLVSHFGAIWAPATGPKKWAPSNGPKKLLQGPQVGGKFGPIPKLRNKPLTKLLGPFFLEKLSDTTRKIIGENCEKQPPLQNLVLGAFYEFGPVNYFSFHENGVYKHYG
jgi:hypothetical protein